MGLSQGKASARRGRPLSPAEREWIAQHVGKLSVRQMAEQLQRPKSTVDRAARAVRAEVGLPDPSLEDLPEPRGQDPPGSTEERLRELASFLRGATMAADERNVAKVASEYRQTLVEIERLEGGGNDGGDRDGGIADIIRGLRP
jgi:hypothetical protein